MTTTTPKMNMEKNSEELKVYMFGVQHGNIRGKYPEDFRVIMAYNDGDAVNQVLKEYPAGAQIFVEKKAQVNVKKIVDLIDLQILTPQPVEVITPQPEKKSTAHDFIVGMMLVADQFVKVKKDREALKKIINKLTGK